MTRRSEEYECTYKKLNVNRSNSLIKMIFFEQINIVITNRLLDFINYSIK